MTTVISIPNIYIASEHYNHLFNIWYEITQLPQTHLDIALDFQDCTFLSHNGVAFLGGLAHFVQSLGGTLEFSWDTLHPKIRTNLAQNGFLDSFGFEQAPWNGNSIPYRIDLQSSRTSVIDYLIHKWLNKDWVSISPALQNAIAGRVWEIYDNAFIHSQTEIGVFSCGQHYPQKKQLHLSVIDFGIGIPAKVRSLTKNLSLSSPQALEWAFFPGNSTATPDISRGMGLHLLQEFLTENQGSLKIFSNDGYIGIKDGKVEYKQQRIDFSGTFVNITFQCDESYYRLASKLPLWDEPLF